MSYNKNLKKLLTASMLAGLAFTAGEAGAATSEIAGNVAAGTPAIVGGGWQTNAWASGNDIKYTGAGTLNMNVASQNINSIDLNNKNAGDITISANNIIIGAIDGTTAGAKTVVVKVNDSMTLTLNGVKGIASAANDYSGLGDVEIGSGAAGATLNITAAGATFAGTFDAKTANTSTMNVSGAGNTFSGAIGAAAALGHLNVSGNNTKFEDAVSSKNISITAGTSHFEGDTNLVDGGGLNIATGATMSLDSDANLDLAKTNIAGGGTLAVTGDSAIKSTGAASATQIGTALNHLTAITVAGAKTLTFDAGTGNHCLLYTSPSPRDH
jgi:hypothetical protein